jgi:basic salivary proline-rich protein 1/2
MPTLRVTGGALEVEAAGSPSGPVDPGYGVPGPIDPGYGVPLPPVATHPIVPPPVGIWPSPGHPSHQPLPPTYPVDPDYGLPIPPTVWPMPPRPVDPSYGVPVPIAPTHPIYLPPPGPNNDLPLPPGSVWPPLPPSVTGQIMCMVWIVGVGYRWTVIDASLKPTHPIMPPSAVPHPGHDLPGSQPHPDQGLPGGPPPRPDQGLPPSQPHPDQGLPPGAPSGPPATPRR